MPGVCLSVCPFVYLQATLLYVKTTERIFTKILHHRCIYGQGTECHNVEESFKNFWIGIRRKMTSKISSVLPRPQIHLSHNFDEDLSSTVQLLADKRINSQTNKQTNARHLHNRLGGCNNL